MGMEEPEATDHTIALRVRPGVWTRPPGRLGLRRTHADLYGSTSDFPPPLGDLRKGWRT